MWTHFPNILIEFLETLLKLETISSGITSYTEITSESHYGSEEYMLCFIIDLPLTQVLTVSCKISQTKEIFKNKFTYTITHSIKTLSHFKNGCDITAYFI